MRAAVWSTMQRAASIGTIAVVAGCSMLGMERTVTVERPNEMPECSTSYLPIAADVVWSGFWVTAVGAGVRAEGFDTDRGTMSALAVGAGLGVVHGISAWYGARLRCRCIHARAAHEQRVRELAGGR